MVKTGEIFVNSTSLEDVVNESTDTQPQSVTSITSPSLPPTPTFEELNSRVEASDRTIQNIKDQQQQLIKLQEKAKQQLNEMDQIKNQCKCSFQANENSGTDTPEYDCVDQVRNDMTNLVTRMKNLTTFIHNQNELSALLGEDDPDITAEQELLQKKLEELKLQRQEMKNLVSELQEINNAAEKCSQNQQDSARSEFRVVPIELIGAAKSRSPTQSVNSHHQNGNVSDYVSEDAGSDKNEDDDCADIAETSDLIRQKMADINAMKSQLKRLKDMMETVRLIEEKTEGKCVKEIGFDFEECKTEMKVNRCPHPKAEANEDDSPRELPRTNRKSESRDYELSKTVRKSEAKEDDELSKTSRRSEPRESELPKTNKKPEMKQNESPRELSKASVKSETKGNEPCKTSRCSTSSRNSISPPKPNKRHDSSVNKQRSRSPSPRRQSRSRSITPRDIPPKINRGPTSETRDESALPNELSICEKVRLLHEMTQDLREQACHLASERDRLKAIKDEMKKRKDVDEKNAINDVNSPRTVNSNTVVNKESEKEMLNSECNCKEFEDADDICKFEEGELNEPEEAMKSGNKSSYFQENAGMTLTSNASSARYGRRTAPLTPTQGKDSADSGAADVHGVHFEACSLQSGSSQSFTMPPAMRALNNRETWRKSSQDNSQPPFEHYTNQPSLPVAPCNSCYNIYQNQFSSYRQNLGTTNDHPCGQEYQNNAAMPTAGNQQQVVQPGVSDPLLLQQFIQTQQMLINSVCQCNQLLWHQQREINSLNNTIRTLQEHLSTASIPTPDVNAVNAAMRSGSVPPTSFANNLCNSVGRAQSEQPQQATPLTYNTCPQSPSPARHFHCYSSCFQRRNAILSSNIPCNSPSIEQGSAFGSNNTNMYSQLQSQMPCNNMQSQQQTSNFLNRHSAGCNQQSSSSVNNSNQLSQQNCSNSGTQRAVSVPNASSNAAAAAAALNNQVPPGNRANNYWDNFRSYSRQNLLSTNSCKSNEEQNQQQISTSPFGVNTPININSNGLRNLQHVNESSSGNSSANSNILTPPNFDNNKYIHTFRNQINNTSTGQQQQQTYPSLNPNCSVTNTSLPQGMTSINNMGNVEQQGGFCLNHQTSANICLNQQNSQEDNVNLNEELSNINNVSNGTNNNNVAAIFGSPDFRNMNFNFGVNELRKKIPVKPSCNTKRLRPTQSAPLNGTSTNNQRLISNVGSSFNQQDNFSQQINQQNVNQMFEQDNTLSAQGAVGIDETSDEIKRNLLVNALKSDKFTSKFFESLKEDVYREVYAIIQATESNPHYLIQLFKELQLVSTSDPLRNIVMQAMHDLYKRSCEAESGDGYNDLDFPNNNIGENQTNITQSPLLQNNETLEGASSLTPENNRDNEIMNGLLNSPELRRLAYKIMFESSSPTRTEKGKKSGVKYDVTSQTDSSKIPNEFYRPDYELVNHVISNIRNTIRFQHIDNDTIIRIAKLTFSTLENLSSTIGRNKLQIDRSLISPKELYMKMKSFEIRDRETFLARYEAYLQTLFVMKIVNEDANNINLANRKPRENTLTPTIMASANALSLTNEDVQHLRRHAQACKSNIPIIGSDDLGIGLNSGRKNIPQENGFPSANEYCVPTQNSNNHPQSQNIITPADVALIFNGDSNIGSSNSVQDQISSLCSNNNNIMNEDLAEADQICSSNSTATNSGVLGAGSARGSFSSDHQVKRLSIENSLSEQDKMKETEKEDYPHSIVSGHQSFNQTSSAIDRESLEDGYDGLCYGNYHPISDQSNSETLAVCISDHENLEEEILPMSLDSNDISSVNPTVKQDSSGINANSFTDTSAKRNSVP